ncbi:hypothetical protein J6590_105037, partial [Homalodisca vitripennis]
DELAYLDFPGLGGDICLHADELPEQGSGPVQHRDSNTCLLCHVHHISHHSICDTVQGVVSPVCRVVFVGCLQHFNCFSGVFAKKKTKFHSCTLSTQQVALSWQRAALQEPSGENLYYGRVIPGTFGYPLVDTFQPK